MRIRVSDKSYFVGYLKMIGLTPLEFAPGRKE
jgi:hypothetical protein